ncbi:MAG TPA: branched-chain amino acid ABC transporter permease [Gammaproteobacteria bacterium]
MDALQYVENFLQALAAGLLTGTNYGLLCVGLTLIFGVMRVINFAQGEFMMLGMYFAFYAFGVLGGESLLGDAAGPFVVALLAGPAIFLVGLVVHRGLLAGVTGMGAGALEGEGQHAQLILTLGLSLVLQNAGLYVFGSAPESISTPLSYSAWEVGPLYGDRVSVFVNQGQTVAAGVALAVVASIAAVMGRTRLGRALRASADNPRAAIYMGIDVARAYRIAFGLGVGITAVGGGLLASTHSFQPYVGLEYVIIMYAGVVLGGLGSLSGAFLGGLTIGLVQQLSTLFLPIQLQNTAIFVAFLIVILLKPDGLFGRAVRRA